MAVAAKSFGRRPRDPQGVASPGAPLGAVLELLRALNWFIRADVPWPTERGKVFDFVLAGESGVFALWANESEPDGVQAAAAALGDLLGGVRVRPVICRESAALTTAHPDILYCTPSTALDLVVGLPSYGDAAAIRVIVGHLRELDVPLPPEPSVFTAKRIEEPKAARSTKPPRAEKAAPEAKPAPIPEPVLTPEPSVLTPEPSVLTPERAISAGRHRGEKPRKVRKVPPPPVDQKPEPTIELPTAIAPVRERRRTDDNPAQRFDNNYVFVPEPASGPSAARRHFRPKLFTMGLVGLLFIAAIAAVGVKEWPRVNAWIHPDGNPSTTFGQPLTIGANNFHPSLTVRASAPRRVAARTYTVRVVATNTGTGNWQVPSRNAYVLVDSLGAPYVATSVSNTAVVKAHQNWTGTVAFTLLAGRTPKQFEFTIASGSSQKAIWTRVN